MKTHPLLFPAALCAALSFTARAPVSAQTPAQAQTSPPSSSPDPAGLSAASRPDTAQLLREALFEEQGLRDADKAAAAYEKVIAAYDAERSFAATAIYRLAEVRRAQNKKDQAAALYQRLLAEFPNHDPLARLSRENLAALGVKEVPGGAPESVTGDEQDARIGELKQMLKDSPDLVKGLNPNQPLWMAVQKGQTRVVTFLLEAGAKATGQILAIAAGNGHLSVCEALIAHGADVNSGGALNDAAGQDRVEVVRMLLEKGADPKGNTLEQAAGQERTEMVRMLLEKGADPNFVEKETGDNPLFSAVRTGNREIIDLLIAAKASPNLPPPSKSPLYFAVKNGGLEMAKHLIGLGADIHVRCMDSSNPLRRRDGSVPMVSGGRTPVTEWTSTLEPESGTLVHAAILSGKPEMLDLLLTSGAGKDINTPGGSGQFTPLALAVGDSPVAMIEALLKAGANPNAQAVENPSVSMSPVYPVLFIAGTRPEGETLVKLLLAAGADAKAKADNEFTAPGYLFRRLGEKGMPICRLLIAAGADPQQMYDTVTGSALVVSSREFRYPGLAASGQVTLSLPESGFLTSLAKASDQAGGAPAGLPDLLLEAKGLRWITQLPPDWGTLHLFRRDPQGALKEEVVKDWMSGPAPVLQWGDIVEFVSADWQRPDTRAARNYNYKSDLPQELRNRLQAVLVRHVTVTLDGKTWPVTLRGALKVYNPLKPEAPLTDAASLMKMMGGEELRWYYAGVKVKRQADQGGGEITSPLREAIEIPLKEGDALELVGQPAGIMLSGGMVGAKTPDSPFQRIELGEITLLSPGLPFSKSMTVTGNSGSPTLIEFLAASWPAAGAEAWKKMSATENVSRFTELTGKSAVEALAGEWPQSVLPHPDWSQLKIRRVGESGETTEIPVNLAAAIAACTEATTPEEARKSDVALKVADVILLPVRQDQRDQPWTGWDADTLRFFSKALSMKVTLSEEDGSFRALSLEYLPLRYVETPAGLIGLPAAEPAPQRLNRFRASDLVEQAAPGRTFNWLARAGSPVFEKASAAALLPGDNIGVKPLPPPAPRGGVVLPPTPQPAPLRVVLPPGTIQGQ